MAIRPLTSKTSNPASKSCGSDFSHAFEVGPHANALIEQIKKHYEALFLIHLDYGGN